MRPEITILKKKYDFKQIDLRYEFNESLPKISCDRVKLEQVFLNLLKNAAQALAEVSERNPVIIIRTSQDSDNVFVDVQDNGPGMDEHTRKRAFEPFFTTKEVGMGTGLGLSVSYFIITENHGGSMNIESTKGQGTTFTISLPKKE